MNTTKLYLIGAAVILILIGGWYIFGIVEENGKLTQDKANLEESLENSEKENKKLKAVAKLNAETVANAAAAKTRLIIASAKLAKDLEKLKNENADIKKWSISVMPVLLAYKLLDVSDDNAKNGLYKPAEGVVTTDGRAEIEVQNEDLYKYADELKTAVRSCNADKAGLREWYYQAGIILQ